MNKVFTVADLDSLMPSYHVFSMDGRELGSKSKEFGYLKPEYDSRGRRVFGKWVSFKDMKYKTIPPWFKFSVVEIKNSACGLGVYVKE